MEVIFFMGAINGIFVGACLNMLTLWIISRGDKKRLANSTKFELKKHIVKSMTLSKECLEKYENTEYVAKWYWLGCYDNSCLIAKEMGMIEGKLPASLLDRQKNWRKVPTE